MPRPATNNREKLVETALDLIWRSSYGSVSVDDICKASEVKKGSFYHYFKSKSELAIAAMDKYWEDKQGDLNHIFSPSKPALNRFKDFSDFIIQMTKEKAETYGHVVGCPFSSLGLEVAGNEETIRARCDKIINEHKTFMLSSIRDAEAEGAINNDEDADLKAERLLSFITGLITTSRLKNSTKELERDLEDGIMKILNLKV
ncbi:MAG: TetR/AcrR family transcriptional regulator [Pseudomonadota bacterium]|nr:TetR/AcrR family transcriptional regulator [Pseudomonadota bacterium]